MGRGAGSKTKLIHLGDRWETDKSGESVRLSHWIVEISGEHVGIVYPVIGPHGKLLWRVSGQDRYTAYTSRAKAVARVERAHAIAEWREASG